MSCLSQHKLPLIPTVVEDYHLPILKTKIMNFIKNVSIIFYETSQQIKMK